MDYQVALSHQFSIFPLVGGADPALGKRPAHAWSIFRQRHPTDAELRRWFDALGYTAYGIVCGHISRLIVLDFDVKRVARAFRRRFPHLCDTLIVESGCRGTPHIYWRVDFPVKTCRLKGGDLKAEGSYVVGFGSVIGDHHWQISQGRPIRSITAEELAEVLAFLKVDTLPKVTSLPTTDNLLSIGDLPVIYRGLVKQTGERNNMLFQVACLTRDVGQSQAWAVEMLADVHARMPPLDGSVIRESYERRYKEALATIASAYSRPPRRLVEDIRTPAGSRLPNALRETLLQQPDGPAILRTLEGLLLKGIEAGQLLTEKLVCHLLKGIVGRHSIRKALQAVLSGDTPLFMRFVRKCPTNKNASFCLTSSGQDGSALAGGGPEGDADMHRPAQEYIMPDVTDLCKLLDIECLPGDPIQLQDLNSRRSYREALERELIRKRPGVYHQAWLAARLGISDRSIRRYHKHLGIRSRRCYVEIPLGWYNLQDTLMRVGDEPLTGGRYLLDDLGQAYPPFREIAAQLLKKGRRVVYRTQTANVYWIGEEEPVHITQRLNRQGYQRQEYAVLSFDQLPEEPGPVQLNWLDLLDQPPLPSPTPAPQVMEPIYVVPPPHVRQRSPSPPEVYEPRQPRSARFYERPLPDPAEEDVARWVHKRLAEMSLSNARRLVDLYGRSVVSTALSRTLWFQEQGKIYAPVGFMITISRLLWRERHGFHVPCPVFAGQPNRQHKER